MVEVPVVVIPITILYPIIPHLQEEVTSNGEVGMGGSNDNNNGGHNVHNDNTNGNGGSSSGSDSGPSGRTSTSSKMN
jgi:hypothetical protein